MRYFRAPELAFWAVVVALLAGVMIFAATRGHDPAPGGRSEVPLAAPAATDSQAAEQVSNLRALMPSGVAAGTNPAGLTGYADAVSEQAREGAVIRQGEGAPETDPMLRGFNRIHADAARLRGYAADPVVASALRTQIGLDVSRLHLLTLGQPAPELPDVGIDPFIGQGTLSPVTPTVPPQPAAPTLTEKKK